MNKKKFDYENPVYLRARSLAFDRSSGWCQFCGIRKAEEAHHWRGYRSGRYKAEEATTADELIALCGFCHGIATAIRKEYLNQRKIIQDRYEKGLDFNYQDDTPF